MFIDQIKIREKNEKRRQARKSAVATFNSQDTTTTTFDSGETGPIRAKKNKGSNRMNNLVGRIEIPMVNKVSQMMTPPLSSPNTPILMQSVNHNNSNNNNNNNNNNNLIYTSMPLPYAEPEDIMNGALTAQDLQLQQMRMQELLNLQQQHNALANLSFSDLTPGSFHEETVDPLIFSFPGDDFYPSHNSSYDSTTSNNSDLSNQKINTSSCNNYPEFRDNNVNVQGLSNIFSGFTYL